MFVQDDAEIPGLCRISLSPDWPRPHLAVVGSLHGNEPCGSRAIARLKLEASEGRLGELRGTLLLLEGNPEAVRQGRRFTEGGCDLNRLFDYAFLTELSGDQWSYEHHRAKALQPLIEDIDGLIDLHSSTRPTPAFGIATELPASAELAAKIGVEFVVRGWSGPGMLGHRVMLAPLDDRGVPSAAAECGQHAAEDAPEVAYRIATAFLRALGGLPAAADHAGPVRWLRLHDAIRKPSSAFRFERPLAGFEQLTPGAVIGHDGLLELRVEGACTTVMPNDTVAAGDDMLFLAVDDSQSHP